MIGLEQSLDLARMAGVPAAIKVWLAASDDRRRQWLTPSTLTDMWAGDAAPASFG
jgi:hypothetical protein